MPSFHIVAAIFILYVSNAIAAFNETTACIQRTCSVASAEAESLASFLDHEETEHPQLVTKMAQYQSRIDRVREIRRVRMQQTIIALNNRDWLTSQLSEMPREDILQLFLNLKPWNLDTQFLSGKFVVEADPLFSSDQNEKNNLVRSLFHRFLAISPLYKLEVESKQLQVDVRKVLGLSPTADVHEVFLKGIEKTLSILPSSQIAMFRKKIVQLKTQAEVFGQILPDESAAGFGELELEILIAAGRVNLNNNEINVLKDIILDRITAGIAEKSAYDLTKFYKKEVWDKKCKFALNRSLHYGLSDEDARRMEVLKKDAYQRAINTSKEIFGSEIANYLPQYFATVKIGGPLSLEKYFKLMDARLAENISANWSAHDLFDLYNMIYTLREDGDDELETICNSWIFKPLRDSESGGKVILSSYAIRNYQMGIAILTHEMGHAASEGLRILSEYGKIDISKFMKMRQCLNENYRSLNRKGFHFPNDKQWTEEDWADTFSGRSTRDLTAVNTCTFLGAYPERDYVFSGFRGEDFHSPTFYRVLNVVIHSKGELSNQCSSAIQNEFPDIQFKNCLDNPEQ